MQPPPNIGRDLIPDNAYLLGKYSKNIREHEIRASQRHPCNDNDKTYSIMRQRGLIPGLPEALEYAASTSKRDYSFRNPRVDIAEKLGVKTYQIPLADYRAAMTLDAQRPSYVPSANPTRYLRGLEDELLNYEV